MVYTSLILPKLIICLKQLIKKFRLIENAAHMMNL